MTRQHRRSILALVTLVLLTALGASGASAEKLKKKRVLRDLGFSDIVRFELDGGLVKELDEANVAWNYAQGFVAVQKTEEKGVNMVIRGAAVYVKVGKKLSFKTFRLGETSYEGIPQPTLDDVRVAMQANARAGYLDHAVPESSDLIEIRSFRIAEPPRWTWHTMNRVGVDVVVEYVAKTANRKVTTFRELITYSLFRDAKDDAWDKRCTAGTDPCGGMETRRRGERETLEVRELSAEEAKALVFVRDGELVLP